MTHPVLILLKENKPFHIFSDASKCVISFVLTQEFQGKLHPIAYGSKVLHKHQSNRSVTCMETFALVSGGQGNRFYIPIKSILL